MNTLETQNDPDASNNIDHFEAEEEVDINALIGDPSKMGAHRSNQISKGLKLKQEPMDLGTCSMFSLHDSINLNFKEVKIV